MRKSDRKLRAISGFTKRKAVAVSWANRSMANSANGWLGADEKLLPVSLNTRSVIRIVCDVGELPEANRVGGRSLVTRITCN